LCIAAYGFLVRERSLFPPQVRFRGHAPALPSRWWPRGRPEPARAPWSALDRLGAPSPRDRLGPPLAALPLLPAARQTLGSRPTNITTS